MQEYSWIQVLGLAGIDVNDNALERDIKFDTWINRRKYRVVTAVNYNQEHEYALHDGIEILIIKE